MCVFFSLVDNWQCIKAKEKKQGLGAQSPPLRPTKLVREDRAVSKCQHLQHNQNKKKDRFMQYIEELS